MTTFILFSFASKKNEDLQKPQCMLCETVFSNVNLKPFKLQKHFDKLKKPVLD